MECPHDKDLSQLADVVLGSKTCPIKECDPMKCVDRLEENLRLFFQSTLPEALASKRKIEQCGYEDAETSIRSKLGIWYATSFLTGLYLGSEKALLRARMKALAKEALQWHDEAFLTHVLVYFRSPKTEFVQHYTTVLDGGPKTREKFLGFLESLQRYVSEYGTTVRGDGHLKRVIGEVDKLVPLSKANIIGEDLEDFGIIKLPKNKKLTGDEEIYGKILIDHFREIHPTDLTAYGQLHLAGGCDTQYLYEEQSIGAVAHMYIAYKSPRKDNHTFNHTMRAMLSRLAMTFSLEEMSRQADEKARAAANERHVNHQLLKRVKELDKAVTSIEEAARGVRAMISRNVWSILKDWISKLADLYTTNKETQICNLPITGDHTKWTTDHYAAALLSLVSAIDNKEGKHASLTAKWMAYREDAYKEEAAANPIWRCLKRRGMLSAGTLSNLEKLDSDIWKDHLSKLVLDDNGCSVLFLLFAIGAMPADSTKTPSRSFFMHERINTRAVVNGLNLLFEAILQHDSSNRNSRPKKTSSGAKINRESEVGIEIDFEGRKKEEFVRICFNPITVWGETIEIISADGFKKVLEKVGEIIEEGNYPHGSHDTSTALLEAVGVVEGNWDETIKHLNVAPTDQVVELYAGEGADRQVMSRAQHSDGRLWLSYRLRP
jgi:hypothetical protein